MGRMHSKIRENKSLFDIDQDLQRLKKMTKGRKTWGPMGTSWILSLSYCNHNVKHNVKQNALRNEGFCIANKVWHATLSKMLKPIETTKFKTHW